MWGRSSTRTEIVSLALLLASASSCTKTPPPAPALKVAAAADLAFAFKDLGDAFEKKTGQKVTFSFGSTGLLAKQIKEGAPFDVFAAANVSFADEVVASGACLQGSSELYARGRIVLWARDNTNAPMSLADLKDPRFAKIAIANPGHAPYGRAAKEALTKAGVWDSVAPRLVFGENVQQTLQFAQSGNAEVAIVALSLALVSGGKYTTIDPDNHQPLDQALVICRGSPESKGALQPVARTFTAFVNSEDGRSIMKRYGFLLPGETLTQTK
ncbi:MAG: molybdate ABC transporter substrate-binding protein [Polyangiaceae bacterium]